MADRPTVAQVPDVTSWSTPRECQGQIIEVAYGQDDEGNCYAREIDHSGPTTSYRAIGHATDYPDWRPWDEVPEMSERDDQNEEG